MGKNGPIDEAIAELLKLGWTLRPQGHRYYLYCPCPVGGSRIRVDNSPRDATNHARRIMNEAAHCPNRHDLDGPRAPQRPPT